MVGACVSSCRDSGEEALSMKTKNYIKCISEDKTLLGIGLARWYRYGFGSRDRKVILSALQRDIASIRQASHQGHRFG